MLFLAKHSQWCTQTGKLIDRIFKPANCCNRTFDLLGFITYSCKHLKGSVELDLHPIPILASYLANYIVDTVRMYTVVTLLPKHSLVTFASVTTVQSNYNCTVSCVIMCVNAWLGLSCVTFTSNMVTCVHT